jgi:thioredoxin reductase (NADPH)
MKIWDAIIIGDGPAGLSAGIYLSRANHSNLIIGCGTGRWHYGQLNQNYLGFPDGIEVDELHKLGLDQAKNYGSEFLSAKVTRLEFHDKNWLVRTSTEKAFKSKAIIYATGVTDRWPKNLNTEKFVGTFVFWCITCDGYRAKSKPIVIVADCNTNVETILQFQDFTSDITVIRNADAQFLSDNQQVIFSSNKIKVINSNFTEIQETDHSYRICIGGEYYDFAMMFSLLGSTPNTALLQELNLIDLDDEGFIKIDDKNRTNHESFFAAGDVTAKHSHQIATAVHEGAQAAQAATYFLYKNY